MAYAAARRHIARRAFEYLAGVFAFFHAGAPQQFSSTMTRACIYIAGEFSFLTAAAC